MHKAKWQSVPALSRNIFSVMNENFLKLDEDYEESLPNFQEAKTLLMGSDYSGDTAQAPYVVYSFLITSLEAWSKWEPKRVQVRQKFLSDHRRMSFKQLGDFQRQRALIPLLDAANSLEGISYTLAINKKSESFFSGPPLDLKNPDFAPYGKWKIPILEKTFVIIHCLSFLLAGLAKKGQDVFWFTDEDNIAANNQRVRELTQLFGWISSFYLTFNLGHCRCGTSRCDDGSRQIEDFLAIPDLIAGALAEQLKLSSEDGQELSNFFWINRGDFSEKTKTITWWFSDCRQPLKRLVSIIDPKKDGHGHVVSWYHFHDQK